MAGRIEKGKVSIMKEAIDIYVRGEHLQYPNPNQYKDRGNMTEDDAMQWVRKDAAYQIARGIDNIIPSIQQMCQDIQHQIFRLGKLGGLKGDSYQAFADKVGNGIRRRKAFMIYGTLVSVGLFRRDSVNLDFFSLAGEKNFIKDVAPGVFIWDGMTEHGARWEKIPTKAKPDFLPCPVEEAHIVFERDALHGEPQNLYKFFSPITGVGSGSFIDECIEMAKFIFGSNKTWDASTYNRVSRYDPSKLDRAELFVKDCEDIIFRAIANTIQLWVSWGLLVHCRECGRTWGDVNDIVLYPYEFFHPDALQKCPYCMDFGLRFTTGIRTSEPFIPQWHLLNPDGACISMPDRVTFRPSMDQGMGHVSGVMDDLEPTGDSHR